MAVAYVGEIRMFAGNFQPTGWAFCDGQLLAIAGHDVLFSLLGTTYGGDGVMTFGLPDLRGRVPVHAGSGPGLSPVNLGSKGGAEDVTLTSGQLPAHTHGLRGSSRLADRSTPAAHFVAKSTNIDLYSGDPPNVNMAPTAVTPAGGSQSHTNVQPSLVIHFIISLFGVYPSP